MTWGTIPIDRRQFVGGAAAGLGAGLAGCGQQGGPDGDDGQDGDTQTAEDVQDGGTLIIGQGNDLQNWNILAEGNAFGLLILNRIYEGGLRGDPETDRPVPGLIRDWEVNLENFGTDDPAIVGHLMEGHTWHDGEELTAGDVAFTHRYMEEQGAAGANQTPSYHESVQADSDDGYTVSWFYSRVAANAFLAALGPPFLPKHIWEDVADFTQYNPRTEGEVIGCGAFEVGESNEGEFYEVTTRPKEEIPWNGHEDYPWLHPDGPFIDGIRFEIYQSQAALFQGIIDGEVHMGSGIGTRTLNQAIQASQVDNVQVIETSAPGWEMMMYNMRRVPLDDIAFRQFLSKTYNQRWTVENQLQNIAAEGGQYLVAKPWEFWRPPEVETLLADADSDDLYAPTQYVNEQIADEDIVEPVDIPDLRYPRDDAEWPVPDQPTVDELRDFLLNHPKAEHDYSLGPAESEGADSIDGQEIYVNGEPMGQAHTNNNGQPGEGPIEFNDYPPNLDPQGFERMTNWIRTVKSVGVPTTRSTQPWAQTQPKVYQDENFDVMNQEWPGRLWHVTHLTWMLSGTSGNLDADSTQSATNWNGAGYTGADEMIARQDSFVEPDRRQPWVKQVLAQIYHDQPQTVALYPKLMSTVSREFEGYIPAVGGVFNDSTFMNIRLADG